MRGLSVVPDTAHVRLMAWVIVLLIALGYQPTLAQEAATAQKQLPGPIVTAQQTTPDAQTQGPFPAVQLPATGVSLEDLLLQKGTITKDEWLRIRAEQEYKVAEQSRRLDNLEEWKGKAEVLPILQDRVNFGLNALQFLYGHVNANVPEGKSQDSFSVRRAEMVFWGKLSDYLPRWHMLMEFQSTGLTSNTPTGNSSTANGNPSVATFFREAYIDVRPVQSWAPNLNIIRMGVFRMPFGIFTETSGGLRDIISSPYLNGVGGGGGPGQNRNGTGGAIEFLQERDYFVDVRGKIMNRLEYVVGIMNNNNFQANGIVSNTSGIGGANQPKAVYMRLRLFGDENSFVSFTMIQGTSNNAGTFINGRGKGHFDRYGVDARWNPKFLPGFTVYGEYWQGHDGSNATTVGTPANGDCLDTTVCGGSGAPGANRQTWYVLAKYLFTEGPLENFEPVYMYEEFNPNTSLSNDRYTRQIVGLNYYFENFPPKMQSKLQFNYEFRHHSGLGPGIPLNAANDPFAQNAFFLQWQLRYM
ncbi:MAG TPA: hypothetical protein PKD12_11215 [Nitrospira sp.]|nr:hypothetical protein [Nitrospira sp.]